MIAGIKTLRWAFLGCVLLSLVSLLLRQVEVKDFSITRSHRSTNGSWQNVSGVIFYKQLLSLTDSFFNKSSDVKAGEFAFKSDKVQSDKNRDLRIYPNITVESHLDGSGFQRPRRNNLQMAPGDQRRTIRIAWYHPYHGGLKAHAKKAQSKMSECQYSNCDIFFTSATHGNVPADAVLFQGNNMPHNLPRRANPNQVFVFVNVEAPQYLHTTNLQSQHFRNFFNWTMTYRLDSDIPYKYGEILPKKTAKFRTDKEYRRIFRNKTESIAWFVSHCHTASKREDFVDMLRAHVRVHKFGGCGKLHDCPKQSGDHCDLQVASKYKFYLAMENSLCDDYITEKAYNWFSRDIILVVRGAGNYSRYLPPGTFIDAGNFESIEALGSFLNKVGSNESLYIQYLKEKDKYGVIDINTTRMRGFCQLCEHLNNLPKYWKSYSNIHNWWRETACRQPSDLR